MATSSTHSLANQRAITTQGKRTLSSSFSNLSFSYENTIVAKNLRYQVNSSILKTRASSEANVTDDISKAFIPPAQFYKVEAIIRPWRLTFVAKALLKMGIRGVTVCEVRGFGAQGGSRERQAGSEFTDDSFVSKVKLEIVVVYEQVEEVIQCVIDEARTGEIGDGKIFVSPVAEIIRVRTGERGIQAERMAGGRMEILGKNKN